MKREKETEKGKEKKGSRTKAGDKKIIQGFHGYNEAARKKILKDEQKKREEEEEESDILNIFDEMNFSFIQDEDDKLGD